jgi:hypothetical protein
LFSPEVFVAFRAPPVKVKLVLLSVKPFVVVSEPPETVKGCEQVTLLTTEVPALNSTEAAARLMTTSSAGPGNVAPLQFVGLCHELFPPAPVQVTVAATKVEWAKQKADIKKRPSRKCLEPFKVWSKNFSKENWEEIMAQITCHSSSRLSRFFSA